MELPSWMPITLYAILVVAYLGAYSWRHMEDGYEQRPFAMLAFLTALLLLNDFISRFYIFEGFPHWAVVLTTYINYALTTSVGVQWYLYVRSVLTAEERSSTISLDRVVYIFAAIGFAALLLNPFMHGVFSFDDTGTYHRGSVFFFPAGSAFLNIIIAEVFLVLRVRSLGLHTKLTLLLFPFPPLIGGVIAMFVYGVPWMPLGIAFSMVFLFVEIQAVGMGRDYLTGLFNRRRVEEVLQERMHDAALGKAFAGMMVDLDDFKEINDVLGHATGDLALAEAANLLRTAARVQDVVARYGGDEFLLLLDIDNEGDLELFARRVEQEQERVNKKGNPYRLVLSKGYAIYDPDAFPTPKAFIEHLDKLMYAQKQEHKLAAAARAVEQ